MAEDLQSASLAPDGGWGWCVVLAGFLVNLLSDGFMYASGVLFREVREYFGASRQIMGALASVTVTVAYGSSFVNGTLVTKWGCRRVGFAGAVTFGLGLVLSSFAPSIQYLFFSSAFMAGWGVGLCFIPTVVVVAQYFTKRRSLATGVTMSGSGIGTFLFAPIIGVLLDNYSWRGTYAILGAVAWNCAACAILYRPIASRRHGDDVRSAEVGATSNDVGDTLHQETESKPQTLAIRCSRFLKKRSILLKNKAYIVFSGSLFVSSFGGMVVFAFLPDLAVHAGISIKDATFLVAAVGIASTVSRIALSWLSDRPFVNKPAAYASSVVVMGVSVTLCPLCSERYEALVCNMVLYGTCYGYLVALMPVVLSELVGTAMLADAMGICMSLSSVGLLLGPPFTGLMFDHSGSYTLPFAVMGGLLVFGGILNFFVLCTPESREARKRQRRPRTQAAPDLF